MRHQTDREGSRLYTVLVLTLAGGLSSCLAWNAESSEPEVSSRQAVATDGEEASSSVEKTTTAGEGSATIGADSSAALAKNSAAVAEREPAAPEPAVPPSVQEPVAAEEPGAGVVATSQDEIASEEPVDARLAKVAFPQPIVAAEVAADTPPSAQKSSDPADLPPEPAVVPDDAPQESPGTERDGSTDGTVPPGEQDPKAPQRREEEKGSGDEKRGEDKGCLVEGCHKDLRDRPWTHGPISVEACDSCHEPTGKEEDHKFRFTRPKEALCKSCHEDDEKIGKVVHKPYTESACLECHDPHGGENRSILRGKDVVELCAKCHELPEAKNVHGPVAVGECLLCHAAHHSDNEHLTLLPNREMCVACHSELEERLAAASHVHGPVAVDCGACHLPHGGDQAYFLREKPKALCLGCHDGVAEKMAKDSHVHGAMEHEKACLGCHTPHASESKAQLRGTGDELCLGCHDQELVNPTTGKKVADVSQEILSARFKHGPVEKGDCHGCHFPHSAAHANLLRESYPGTFYTAFSESHYKLCFLCHEKSLVLEERTSTLTGFRHGDQNLHYLHVNREKGRTCRACHEVHASNLPRHIRKSVPFGSAGWNLPINYEKTATGGTCTPGCHKTKSYDNSKKTLSGETEAAAPSG